MVGQYSQDWSGRCSWASGRSLRLTSAIGQWKCFVMVFTFFFPTHVFQPFFQVQPICAAYLLSEAIFTFLVPCLIFSISSLPISSAYSPTPSCLGFLPSLQFLQVSLLWQICSSTVISWIPIQSFSHVFARYSIHSRDRFLYFFAFFCIVCFIASSMVPATGSRSLLKMEERHVLCSFLVPAPRTDLRSMYQ